MQSARKKIQYRNWKALDVDTFKNDLADSELISHPSDNVNDLVLLYNNVLKELVDKHAPLKDKMISIRPRAPWYTSDIDTAKRHRRKLEHKWLKSALTCDWLCYKEQCQIVNSLLFESKKKYFNSKIKEASGDQKSLFKVMNKLFHNHNEPILPSHDSLDELANRFADVFITKITNIRTNIQSSDIDDVTEKINGKIHLLNDFDPATEEEVHILVMSSSSKSSALDPIPTWLIKICISHAVDAKTFRHFFSTV